MQFRETGFMPSAFRHAMALNSFYTLAAMQGTKELGTPADFLYPPLSGEQRQAVNEAQLTRQAQQIEQLLGI